MNRDTFNTSRRTFWLRWGLWLLAFAVLLLCIPQVREQVRRNTCRDLRGPHFNPAALQKVCHDIPLRK
jgi:hypothetical protein